MSTATAAVIAVATLAVEDLAAKEAIKLNAQEEKLQERYPHIITGSMKWNDTAKKFQVKIECEDCGDTNRDVFTSDLFQVHTCKACSDKRKAARKAKARQELSAARKLIQSK